MNKLNVLVTILNIIIAISGYYLAKKQYLENQKKNSIDIIPMFDIDVPQIRVDVNFELKKLRFTIPLFNLGNGTAIDIESQNPNEKISTSIVMKTGYTYYYIEKNLSYNENEISFKIKFSDLSGKNYEQKFNILIGISNDFKNGYYPIFNIWYYYNHKNEILYAYLLRKQTEKIKYCK